MVAIGHRVFGCDARLDMRMMNNHPLPTHIACGKDVVVAAHAHVIGNLQRSVFIQANSGSREVKIVSIWTSPGSHQNFFANDRFVTMPPFRSDFEEAVGIPRHADNLP